MKYEEYTKLCSVNPGTTLKFKQQNRFPWRYLSTTYRNYQTSEREGALVGPRRGGGRKKRQATRLECFERRGATRRGNAFCRVDAHEEDRVRERRRERGKTGGPVSPLGEPWCITHDTHVLFREECAPRRWSRTLPSQLWANCVSRGSPAWWNVKNSLEERGGERGGERLHLRTRVVYVHPVTFS